MKSLLNFTVKGYRTKRVGDTLVPITRVVA